MTCRTRAMSWLDVLYTSVRQTPGGLHEAADFLARRRGRSIHPETLRAKLRGAPGESMTIELAELLTEWMQDKAGGMAYALDWMQALASQFGMSAEVIPPLDSVDIARRIADINNKVLMLNSLSGRVAGSAVDALADSHLTATEQDDLISIARELRTQAMHLEMLVSATTSGMR